jgi:starch-binding outer membrane protein, SusD/RagB family
MLKQQLTMKKIFVYILLVFSAASCSELVQGLNENPNNPTTAAYQYILTGAEVASIVLHTGEPSRKSSILGGYYTGIDRQHLVYSRYAVTTSSFNADWNIVFVDVVSNVNATLQALEDEGISGVSKGIAQTLNALALGTAAALWGDIPFEDAGNPEAVHPAYESQTAVYAKVQALLDEAISNLSSGTNRPPAGSDIYFNGNPTAWTQVAWTLKARFYVHTKAYGDAYAAAQNGIQTPSGSMLSPHGTANENANLNYQFFAIAVRQADVIVSDFFTAILASDPAINPDISRYRGHAKTDESARFNFLFRKTALGVQPNIINGYAAQTAPGALVTYQENLLILAEAGFRSSGFDTGLQHLNTFRDFMSKGGYLLNAGTSGLRYDAFVAADFQTGGLENPDGLSAENALLREILQERYVTLFGQIEGFNDVRRTATENLVRVPVTPSTGTQLPQRFLYPDTEIERNANAPSPIPGFFEPTPVNQ